jgi:hypothetical protein
VTVIEKPCSEQLLLAKVQEVLDQPARSGLDVT